MAFPNDWDMDVPKRLTLNWGMVKDNADPMRRGRVRAVVPGFWDSKDRSPWIPPIGNPGAGGPKDSPGGFFVPAIEAQIAVGFIQGDIREPYYIAGPIASNEAPRYVLEKDPADAPKVRALETDTFEILIIDTATDKRLVLRSKDLASEVEIDAIDRSVSVKAGNTLIIDAPRVSITGTSMTLMGRPVLAVGKAI